MHRIDEINKRKKQLEDLMKELKAAEFKAANQAGFINAIYLQNKIIIIQNEVLILLQS